MAKEHAPQEVLVAEDEALVRMIIVETLRDAGYVVWEAENGEAALKVMRDRPSIKLLLSDVKMPNMDGYQLLQEGLRIRPDLKAVFISGYAQEMVPVPLRHAVVGVFKKPFDIDELPKRISEAFAGGH